MDFARLEEIILSVCIEAGYELVEIDIAKSKSGDKLTIYIDNLGKITIDDCVKVNNLIEQKTEIDSFFANEYTLEVSSPGPKRPLKKIDSKISVIIFGNTAGFFNNISSLGHGKSTSSELILCKFLV